MNLSVGEIMIGHACYDTMVPALDIDQLTLVGNVIHRLGIDKDVVWIVIDVSRIARFVNVPDVFHGVTGVSASWARGFREQSSGFRVVPLCSTRAELGIVAANIWSFFICSKFSEDF